MTWLPWILLVAALALAGWCSAELGRCLTWARRALLRGQPARRPEGRLVRWLGLDELLRAVEARASGEGEIRAAAARRIEALLAPLTDAVLVVDAYDRLRLANPAAVALFGLSADDAGGAVVPLVRSADFIELIGQVRSAGEAKATILLNRAPLADVWVQAAGARTDPEAFGEDAAIFVLADVTALKRLQAMEREFVTNVSHDLRTPVTILRGYAETLDDDHATMSAEDRTRFIRKIVSSVGRLQGLVEGLLALASLESGQGAQREPGALHRAAREVCEEYRARARAAGVAAHQLIWDPGLGFAKTEAQSLALLDGLERLRAQGYPLLVGPSRKRFIGAVLDEPRPRARLWGTAAVVCKAIAAGADIVRVHDVGPIVQTARMADALWRSPAGSPG